MILLRRRLPPEISDDCTFNEETSECRKQELTTVMGKQKNSIELEAARNQRAGRDGGYRWPNPANCLIDAVTGKVVTNLDDVRQSHTRTSPPTYGYSVCMRHYDSPNSFESPRAMQEACRDKARWALQFRGGAGVGVTRGT